MSIRRRIEKLELMHRNRGCSECVRLSRLPRFLYEHGELIPCDWAAPMHCPRCGAPVTPLKVYVGIDPNAL